MQECFGGHAAVNQPRPRCTGYHDVRNTFPVLGFETRILEHFLGADHGARWREALLAVCAESDFPCEAEILNGDVALHDLGALFLEVGFDLAEVCCSEEDLECFFFDFLFGGCAVASDGFDALGVEFGFFLIPVFVLEANVPFLG